MYSRVLSVLSLLIAVIPLWMFRARADFFLSIVPAWFSVLFVLVRVTPHLIPPRLERLDSTGITTLNIGQLEDNRSNEHDHISR